MSLSAEVAAAYRETFTVAMEDPTRLVNVHRQVTQGRGRRSPELLSLNRSVVVLAIAAWQAYVEAVARALLASLGPEYSRETREGRTLDVIWKATHGELTRQIGQYSTANAENTLRLLGNMGFDPKPWWTWGTGGGHVEPGDALKRLNHWVKVRHAIAHGRDLPDVPVITENRSGRVVRLRDAESCIGFVENLAAQTDHAAQDFARKVLSADARVRSDQLDVDYLLGAVQELIHEHDL